MLETDAVHVVVKPNIDARNARRQTSFKPEVSEKTPNPSRPIIDVPQLSRVPSIPKPPPPPVASSRHSDSSDIQDVQGRPDQIGLFEPDYTPRSFLDKEKSKVVENDKGQNAAPDDPSAPPDNSPSGGLSFEDDNLKDEDLEDEEAKARQERLFGHLRNQPIREIEPTLWDNFCSFWDMGKLALILIGTILFLVPMVFFNQARINDKHTDALKYVNEVYERLNEDDKRIVGELGKKLVEVEQSGKEAEERWKARQIANGEKLDHLNETVQGLMQMYNDERKDMKEFRVTLMTAMGLTEEEARRRDLMGGLGSMLDELGRMSRIRSGTGEIKAATGEIKAATGEIKESELLTSEDLSSNVSIESGQNWHQNTPPPGRAWIWIGDSPRETSESEKEWPVKEVESEQDCQSCEVDSSSNWGLPGSSSSSSISSPSSSSRSDHPDHTHRSRLSKILTAPFRWIGGLF